jgi:hypothetical protein
MKTEISLSYSQQTTHDFIMNAKIFCLPVSYKNIKIKIYETVILPAVL